MGPWMLLGLAAGLGVDAMSVCMAVGVRWNGPRQKFRLAWHMGLFQAIMPLAGFFLGRSVAGLLSSVGTYIAAGLVFLVGLKMFIEALRAGPGETTEQIAEDLAAGHEPQQRKDPTRGWSLLVLSVATSIDALVVGFSAGLRGGNIWQMVAVIGLVACIMSLIGIGLGQRIGKAIGRPAELIGAVVLMGLAVMMTLDVALG
jgi:manganese efflux pump family protein